MTFREAIRRFVIEIRYLITAGIKAATCFMVGDTLSPLIRIPGACGATGLSICCILTLATTGAVSVAVDNIIDYIDDFHLTDAQRRQLLINLESELEQQVERQIPTTDTFNPAYRLNVPDYTHRTVRAPPQLVMDGSGNKSLALHDVLVHKPFPLDQAREIARDIMKSNKDKYMRETSTSYRFRNIPKTKFSSFFTKVLNPHISLIFGQLK